MFRIINFLVLLAALPVYALQPVWFLFARDDGCISLQVLADRKTLSRAPISPEDFAQMMREQGKQVVISPLPDSPSELAGKVVQVKVDGWGEPVFVTEEICRKSDQSRQTR